MWSSRKVTRAPYPLTLGPYGYLWFELHGAPEPVETRLAPGVTEDTLVMKTSDDWRVWTTSRGREALENWILPQFLPKQRWFGGKSRPIASCRIKDWGALDGSTSILTFVEAAYDSGTPETYVLPLAATARGWNGTAARVFSQCGAVPSDNRIRAGSPARCNVR